MSIKKHLFLSNVCLVSSNNKPISQKKRFGAATMKTATSKNPLPCDFFPAPYVALLLRAFSPINAQELNLTMNGQLNLHHEIIT